jgi:hypothetical protein
MAPDPKTASAVGILAEELVAAAQAAGTPLLHEDALARATELLPLLDQLAAAYDAWAAEEEARVLGLLDAQHAAFDGEVARLVLAA